MAPHPDDNQTEISLEPDDKNERTRDPFRGKISKESVKQVFNRDDDEDEETEQYEKSTFEKFINYIFCRGDLARQNLTARPVAFNDLFRYATKLDYLLLFIGCIGAVISGLCQPCLGLLSGQIFQLMIDTPVNSTAFYDGANTYVYIYLGLGIIILCLNFIQFFCFQSVCCRVITGIRQNFMKSLLRQNAGWFDRNHSGTLATQLNENVERIREGVGDKMGLLIRGFSMFIGALVIAFCYEWRIALFMSPLAPLACLCMSAMARKIAESTANELKDVGHAGAVAEESILGVRTVQALNGQEHMVQKYKNELEKGSAHAKVKSFWSGFLGGLFFVILFIFMGTAFLLGGYLLRVGLASRSGDIFTAVVSMMIGAYFLGMISPHLMVLLNARVSAAVIYKTIDRKPPIDSYSENGRKLENVRGNIQFKNVHFRYPTRRDVKVLTGLNLTIEEGKTVAFVGHSGCGKSTSVGLITRLYEAESGKVTIDGEDVRSLNLHWLRSLVGVVQQEPNLFNDTIEQNLKIGHPEISQEEMIQVCKMANAHDFIMKLPKGYSTLIGEGGVQLSGGQKQRIAIARTLARNPRILLLDEATSALDAQSESIVQEALDNAAHGRTTIVIAHRMSTIRNVDKIVLFDKGVVAEAGTHAELIELDGKYAQMIRAQQFQPEEGEIEDDEEEIVVDESEKVRTKSEELRAPPRFKRDCRRERLSSSGSTEFIRGAIASDSFRSRSSFVTAADQFVSEHDGDKFAEQIEFEMKKDGKMTAGLLTVYRNAHGAYLSLTFAVLTAMIRGFEMPCISIAFGMVFKAFETGQYDPWLMQHQLIMALLVYLGIALLVFIFQFISSLLFGRSAETLVTSFRVRSLRNILMQDAGYFDNPQHSTGRLITRLASDAPNVKAVLDGRMMFVVYNFTAWIICIIIGIVNAWPIGVLGVLLSLTLATIIISLSKGIQTNNLRSAKKNPAGKYAVEILDNIRTVQLLTREQYFFDLYKGATRKQKRSELFTAALEAADFASSQTFIYFALASCYALGNWLLFTGINNPTSTYTATVSQLLSCMAIMNCSNFFPELIKARTASSLLFNVINRKPKTGDYMDGEKLKIRGNVLFEDVHFCYPQRPRHPAMTGLQFTAQKGQTVALVGPSGSGKSTVISLMERFYDTISGSVKLDGRDIKKLSLHHLRTQMALVGQEPRLFAGTIRENICLGMKEDEISEAKIREALITANALNFVNGLPEGLDTQVGEKGTQLSGGQKQRIAIARALIRDPTILLLDEATSALDSESERAVQEALENARQGRTCITIAHRLSSIQHSDLIIYVENGRVRESGTHAQLVTRRGHYYRLTQKQDLTG